MQPVLFDASVLAVPGNSVLTGYEEVILILFELVEPRPE